MDRDWDRELKALGEDLRRRFDQEIRDDAAEDERLTEQRRLRHRRLTDAAADSMNRGDTVTVISGDRSLSGTLVASQGDVAVLDTGRQVVDINLEGPVLIRVDERANTGGVVGSSEPRSFRARLAEYEQSGEPVEIIAASSNDALHGRIAVVATDHAVVQDATNRDWFLPLASIGMIVRSTPS